MTFSIYRGPRPAVHGQQGRYRVNLDEQISAVYPIDRREVAILTSEEHPRLVAMVNEVKESVNGTPGGPFLINEHSQVLVPSSDGTWYCAGLYTEILSFDLDGEIISPAAPSGLEPGDDWPGPRVGMSYTLAAGGEDIYLKYESAPQRIKQDYLSDHCGKDKARFLAERLAEVKGKEGGRIYINEAREFFAPKGDVPTPPYLYLGPLDDESWFPALKVQ
jgi:hypothetical protein